MVGGRIEFDFQHCFAVINLLAAIGAIVKLHLWNGVSLPFIFADDVAHHAPNLVTATGWTSIDLEFTVHNLSIAQGAHFGFNTLSCKIA